MQSRPQPAQSPRMHSQSATRPHWCKMHAQQMTCFSHDWRPPCLLPQVVTHARLVKSEASPVTALFELMRRKPARA